MIFETYSTIKMFSKAAKALKSSAERWPGNGA